MKLNSKSTILKEYASDDRIKCTNSFCAHGITSVYEHSYNVGAMSCWIARKIKTVNQKDVVLGALLHDFYLYDWHQCQDRKQHHKHGLIAAKKAKDEFGIDSKTQNIIESHMWPLNFQIKPRSKEAVIVNFSDKICALMETTEGFCYKMFTNKKQ